MGQGSWGLSQVVPLLIILLVSLYFKVHKSVLQNIMLTLML